MIEWLQQYWTLIALAVVVGSVIAIHRILVSELIRSRESSLERHSSLVSALTRLEDRSSAEHKELLAELRLDASTHAKITESLVSVVTMLQSQERRGAN